ncbi:DUF7168 domain-containing protein [Candidatus Vondammii sp. HM_W22]|uniref:DUF7168 domain-containing protein n=1 Tax=Candidatus Vondammii sp. HM_W22 TaxID=2687299 RepID=UPI001F135F1B|nr:hypothetical protein [Candidatus Vondammii sp. HM_W22]
MAYRKSRTRGKSHNRSRRADDYALGWVIGVRSVVEEFAESIPKIVNRYMDLRHTDLQPIKQHNRKLDRGRMAEGYTDGEKVRLHQGVGMTPQRRLEG